MSDPRPIQVGDELHGYCGGYFGRDDFDCGIVEAVGPDWVIKRVHGRYREDATAAAATGIGILKELAQYREPRSDGCQWGTCPMGGGNR